MISRKDRKSSEKIGIIFKQIMDGGYGITTRDRKFDVSGKGS
jgi:hypothetical protein